MRAYIHELLNNGARVLPRWVRGQLVIVIQDEPEHSQPLQVELTDREARLVVTPNMRPLAA